MEPLHPLHPGLGLKAIPRHLLVQFLRQAEQEQRLVAEISRLLAQPFRLQQLLHDICRGVRQVLGYMAVSIMLVDEAGTTLTIEGYDGVEPNYVQQLNRTLAVRLDHPTLGQGPSATAFRTGQPQAVGNVYTDPRFQPWVALRPGFAAMIALPLTFRGTGIGVLNCYTHRPHQFEPREVALLEAEGGRNRGAHPPPPGYLGHWITTSTCSGPLTWRMYTGGTFCCLSTMLGPVQSVNRMLPYMMPFICTLPRASRSASRSMRAAPFKASARTYMAS